MWNKSFSTHIHIRILYPNHRANYQLFTALILLVMILKLLVRILFELCVSTQLSTMLVELPTDSNLAV